MSAIDSLATVLCERNKRLAGCWLLGLLGRSIPESGEGLQLATQCATQTARIAELVGETYYYFDIIDDQSW